MMRKKTFNIPFMVLATVCLLVTGCNKTPQSNPEPEYNIVRPEFTPDYDNYTLSGAPMGFNMTYYSDIYSRGFAWLTDLAAQDSKLYLVHSVLLSFNMG